MSLMRLLKVSALLGTVLTACGEGTNTQLQAELLEMGRMDQEVREPLAALMQDLPESAEEFMAAVEEQNRVDAGNFSRLEAIVAEYGWPGRQLVGEEATGAALIVLQHAGVEHQKRYLPLLKAAAADDDIGASQVAKLEDGIRQGEGRDQIYGTRVVSDADGKPFLYPIEDPESLDERREAVGLPPIESQLEDMEAEIGMSIGRGNLAR